MDNVGEREVGRDKAEGGTKNGGTKKGKYLSMYSLI